MRSLKPYSSFCWLTPDWEVWRAKPSKERSFCCCFLPAPLAKSSNKRTILEGPAAPAAPAGELANCKADRCSAYGMIVQIPTSIGGENDRSHADCALCGRAAPARRGPWRGAAHSNPGHPGALAGEP